MRDCDLASEGGDVHDVAAPPREHIGKRGIGVVHGAPEVDRHGFFEIFDLLVREGADLDDAGVVDQNVNGSEVRAHGRVKSFDLLTVGDVANGGVAREVQRCELVERAGDFGFGAGVDRDLCASASEFLSEREAESAGTTGDHDDFAVEVVTRAEGAAKCEDGSDPANRKGSGGDGGGVPGFFHGYVHSALLLQAAAGIMRARASCPTRSQRLSPSSRKEPTQPFSSSKSEKWGSTLRSMS